MSYIIVETDIRCTDGSLLTYGVEDPYNAATGKPGRLSRRERAAIDKSVRAAILAGYMGDGDTIYPRIEPDGCGDTEIALYLSDYDRGNVFRNDMGARSNTTGNILDPWHHVERQR